MKVGSQTHESLLLTCLLFPSVRRGKNKDLMAGEESLHWHLLTFTPSKTEASVPNPPEAASKQ